jgi:phosphoribosylformimino-5-aminoimidazole carboxamide ribotide isomerase
MIAIPALDLREGHCVQLVGGDYAVEAIRLSDPLRVAAHWAACGFKRLHIVDLDAATERSDNTALVRNLLEQSDVRAQVGGGVRDATRLDALLGAGAERVVVGTRAVGDLDWLAQQAARQPQRIVLAADVRGRRVVSNGWRVETPWDVRALLDAVSSVPLAAILVTCVEQEGRMQGTDLSLLAELAERAPWPLIASGGIGTVHDLRALSTCGIAETVLGMSLYSGALDARAIAEEFAA